MNAIQLIFLSIEPFFKKKKKKGIDWMIIYSISFVCKLQVNSISKVINSIISDLKILFNFSSRELGSVWLEEWKSGRIENCERMENI